MIKNVAILTDKNSWFLPYTIKLCNILKKNELNVEVYNDHESIKTPKDVVLILSYFKIIPENFLKKNKYNLVVHESDLPQGRGWAPLFWQILEGKNNIPIVLFEATKNADEGKIYIKDYIELTGDELNTEIRSKQAEKTIELCIKFLENNEKIYGYEQKGKPTYYPKRTPDDSELDINKSIREQFNLLRIVNNENFPAFFYYKGNKYSLKIYKED